MASEHPTYSQHGERGWDHPFNSQSHSPSSLDMSGSARPPAGYHTLMLALAVNAFMPPAVNVFMQAVSTRSCVGIVSALTRCVANINQDNRRFLRLSSVGSLLLAKNALHCTSYIMGTQKIAKISIGLSAKTLKLVLAIKQ